MPLRFVLDEHLRGGGLWQAIQQYNARGAHPLDAVRVGDPPDLPLGATDPDILLWAEREGRILITRDQHTMPGHLARHLQAGQHSPGILVVRPHTLVSEAVASLVLVAHAGDPAQFQDCIERIPF
jgi:Domain of unknown function (DUF5615)